MVENIQSVGCCSGVSGPMASFRLALGPNLVSSNCQQARSPRQAGPSCIVYQVTSVAYRSAVSPGAWTLLSSLLALPPFAAPRTTRDTESQQEEQGSSRFARLAHVDKAERSEMLSSPPRSEMTMSGKFVAGRGPLLAKELFNHLTRTFWWLEHRCTQWLDHTSHSKQERTGSTSLCCSITRLWVAQRLCFLFLCLGTCYTVGAPLQQSIRLAASPVAPKVPSQSKPAQSGSQRRQRDDPHAIHSVSQPY